MKILFVSWAEYCSRSDNIARELGGSSHMVYWGWLGSNIVTVWLKYLGQMAATLALLFGQRPHVVFVMAPPVFAVLAVYIYSILARVPFVIDAHTAAFLHPRWTHLQWLQRFLCRRAATTIVTNEHLAQIVRSCGANATIVRDVPVKFVAGEEFEIDGAFNVGVVCSFNDDEPVEEIFRAAADLEDVHFYITGNPKYLSSSLRSAIPGNVTLTGFISDAAYGSLLTRVDVVITLTTRNHTMLRGAYEAVYQGTPVIVSDWPLLREAFDEGAIQVDNSPEQLVAAIREMQANLNRYRAEVIWLRERKYAEWGKIRQGILIHVMKDPERVKSSLDALSRYEGRS
jgi:glycosyltransferase involved in cell wall biosynthesis